MDPVVLQGNLARIRERIARACAQAGRDPASVTLCAVTKTHPVATMLAALELGLTDLGENRVQDALPKLDALPDHARVHFIGRLQTNKVNKVAGRFASIQSVDRIGLLERLDHRCAELDVVQSIWIQVSVTGEEQKGGCPPEELPDLWGRAVAAPGLRPVGLMTLGAAGADEATLRATFGQLRDLAAALRRPDGAALELSMGMSDDFELALLEGSTHVRLGTALFGPRRR